MSRHPTGLELEELKRRSRARHRDRIQSAYESAMLCRKHYDEQRAAGEIGQELLSDLSSNTFRLYHQLRPALIDTDYEDDLSPIRETYRTVLDADEPLEEIEEVTPQSFAMMIDRMDAIATKTGLVEVDG